MKIFFRICMLVLLSLVLQAVSYTYAQELTSLRRLKVAAQPTIPLDSLSLYPGSLQVFCGDLLLSKEDYEIDFFRKCVNLRRSCSDSVLLSYRVFPIDLNRVYRGRDSAIIFDELVNTNRADFMIETKSNYNDIFGNTGIKKNGSISRGVSFGNNQNLSVNSNLNLELSGDIAPNVKILASITDDNLPIQPDGNTNKLQEFDRVFIQLYNEKFKVIAGDFWINKPDGYFLNYRKRAQGLYGNYTWKTDENSSWNVEGSVAFSKGKFARQNIQGVEANQGPYRLRGNENEPYIIVLSGTEKVYIDGRLLTRGQENDYVINYNTAEITFTSRNLITKDIRIVVEFQYSDQNYARSLIQGNTQYKSKNFSFWANMYSEQDAKNQSIQQQLSNEQKFLLYQIGDTLDKALTNSIDSIGYLENQNLYKLISFAGYDSVLVYSVSPDSALYRATFAFVGAGNGDYILQQHNALGKVYKWVQPILGVRQGDYIPAKLIITPKKKQMFSTGVSYKFSKNINFDTEFAMTTHDINTFSPYDSFDDKGYSNRTRINGSFPLGKDSLPTWRLNTRAEMEVLSKYFEPIEQYRSVEFDRDWNTRNKGYTGNQFAANLFANIKHKQNGELGVETASYQVGTDYFASKSRLFGSWSNNKGFRSTFEGSYLGSDRELKNNFLRHKVDVSQQVKKFRFGFRDEQERNTFQKNGLVEAQSYGFYDYELYLSSADSAKVFYKFFYRERSDDKSDGLNLQRVAKARNAGGEILLSNMKNHRLNLLANYRQLSIQDSILASQAPENTLIGRVDYELRLFKNAIVSNTFYEVGSGLELRKEFMYIRVNDGQGIYTWIDYNNDGIKDLNEFEVAQFVDQASYIRVFTPSNEYTKVYSNEFNQGLNIRPERIWANKKGVLKVLSLFSDQARMRVNRKTNSMNEGGGFNPFAGEVRDTSLISMNSTIRNSLFFNRTSTIFGAEYVFQDVRSKSLLASGFDARTNLYHEINVRWNIKKSFILENTTQWGDKASQADYTSGRNYDYSYYFVKPAISYQPSTSLRFTLDGRRANKNNVGGESAVVNELGVKARINQAAQGSLQGGVSLINIKYDGDPSTALGFEMLEALKVGKNYTWNISYQRSISKNLQVSFQYNGRKSEVNKAIHSGGMEIRAFF